ncbi:MAG: cell division protein FtsW [Alphaproteobacteria bacterium]|nr:cell division protein FtsW [Alphaproteobacteria bacterium]NCQ87464.1 cell division protein FtsW [Alphaproteobacteria bacterium]NCT06335.1 cell division protein FtsW [Alphaproteobacteria bacterium]
MGLFSRHFSRTSQSITARWWWTVDRAMLAFIFVLYIIGAFMIATASPSVAIRIGAYEYLFLIKHFIVLLPSIIVMLVISLFDVDTLRRASMIAFVGCIVLLIYTLFFGLEVKGAKRWIDLPFFSLQPSEFAKPAFIVVTAWLMARYKENSQFKGHYYAWGLFLFLIALLLLQPDLGMTFVVTVSFFSVMFLAGLPFRYVFILAGLGVTAFVLIYMSFSHVQSRVDRFLNPESGDTYQIEKSLDAFKNGGITGTGPGQGEVKLRIPDAHADFIFSVAAEEFGLFFIITLIGIYGYIFVRGFNRIMDSDNLFIILSVGGLLTMFALQALVHMGSALHIVPTKGMTLPLISYGGSSLLSMSMVMGMILALTRKQRKRGISKGGLTIREIGGEKL